MNRYYKKLVRKYYRRKGFSTEIDFSSLCDQINSFNCAFVKTDVPYMPDDFPKSVPIGKDADIICTRNDFDALCKILDNWAAKFTGYNIIKIDGLKSRKIRIQTGNVLLYQIDLSWSIEGISDGFVDDALSVRIKTESYYILTPIYEYIIRMNAYSKDKKKAYHKKYLVDHKTEYVPEIADKYLGYGIELLLLK